jgi:hypothetical protein
VLESKDIFYPNKRSSPSKHGDIYFIRHFQCYLFICTKVVVCDNSEFTCTTSLLSPQSLNSGTNELLVHAGPNALFLAQ